MLLQKSTCSLYYNSPWMCHEAQARGTQGMEAGEEADVEAAGCVSDLKQE